MILAFFGRLQPRFAQGKGTALTSKGFLELAENTLRRLPQPLVLQDFSRALLEGVHLYRGPEAN